MLYISKLLALVASLDDLSYIFLHGWSKIFYTNNLPNESLWSEVIFADSFMDLS